ncbi:hypothetical protein BTVI_63555 [Pitangus sulphuratus]|nr:hypothetical protein BTVI_63555 [Pitangus sulphuratus]
MTKRLKNHSYEKRLRELGLFRWELINAYKYLTGGYQENGARLFSVVPSDRMRSNGHELKIKKEFLYIEGGSAREQAAQGCHGVSLSGDIKNPPGYIPVSPALGDPALAGGLDNLISRSLF